MMDLKVDRGVVKAPNTALAKAWITLPAAFIKLIFLSGRVKQSKFGPDEMDLILTIFRFANFFQIHGQFM